MPSQALPSAKLGIPIELADAKVEQALLLLRVGGGRDVGHSLFKQGNGKGLVGVAVLLMLTPGCL